MPLVEEVVALPADHGVVARSRRISVSSSARAARTSSPCRRRGASVALAAPVAPCPEVSLPSEAAQEIVTPVADEEVRVVVARKAVVGVAADDVLDAADPVACSVPADAEGDARRQPREGDGDAAGGLGVVRRVDAVAADDGVAAGPADQRVVARTAHEVVAAVAADEEVVCRRGGDRVVARSAVEGVVAGGSRDDEESVIAAESAHDEGAADGALPVVVALGECDLRRRRRHGGHRRDHRRRRRREGAHRRRDSRVSPFCGVGAKDVRRSSAVTSDASCSDSQAVIFCLGSSALHGNLRNLFALRGRQRPTTV